MKLSTKGRYGLRAMIELAQSTEEGPITIHSIASRQDIPERYLEQLMAPLRRAGLVKSVRGFQGGYILVKNAEDITAGDIIRALEGPIAPVECVSEVSPEACERSEHCVTRDLWIKMRDSIAEVLDAYSLADLAGKTPRTAAREAFRYKL
ncbi:HTH-type transcriptional regulator CymR [Sporotomaculum syntrophicum]|uniref:HTH-type transcriptional regulator CymR n=1 Tax=Sporotomaculum syntrophicum TaxID=182264 RepID=A0A9D2WQP6_9FIRM|nr:Rrf2 family transcriptional regulator [Sporotomaculum syntrophicum]KAF1085161.1 HTH-type transcriptional regulator CymR [Sporotomaculum syntrophicum]